MKTRGQGPEASAQQAERLKRGTAAAHRANKEAGIGVAGISAVVRSCDTASLVRAPVHRRRSRWTIRHAGIVLQPLVLAAEIHRVFAFQPLQVIQRREGLRHVSGRRRIPNPANGSAGRNTGWSVAAVKGSVRSILRSLARRKAGNAGSRESILRVLHAAYDVLYRRPPK